MGYYKFGQDDIFRNRIKVYPKNNFFIYEGERYYNNIIPVSGAFVGNVTNVPPGYISLYELNIDRAEHLNTYDSDEENKGQAPGNRSLIAPFNYKNSNNVTFKTISPSFLGSKSTAGSEYAFKNVGDVLTGSYPFSASISKHFFPENTVGRTGSYVDSLKNVTNYYVPLSRHYEYSSSVSNGDPHNRDFAIDPLGMIDIPSIFYGSSIRKSSVSLKFFVSGTLVGHLNDEKSNGELVQIGPFGSQRSGSTSGVVLYNEGVIILTGAYDLSMKPLTHTETYDPYIGADSPKWIYFGSSISSSAVHGLPSTPSSSYILDFEGVNYVHTVTMMAHAQKGTLNHSNNPTYLKFDQTTDFITSSNYYVEPDKLLVANVVSSSYIEPTGSFEKTTYISKIGVYDKNKNLLGIAKMATPIKKTTDRDLTFKLKLDL